MQLLLMRHGIAEEAGPETSFRDEPRRLTGDGISKVTAAARGLVTLNLGRVDLLLTSPLVRCAQTARIVGDALGVTPEVDERLAPGMRLGGLVDALIEHPGAERVLACGHQPDLSHVALELAGGLVEFKKGTVAIFDVDELVRGGGCLLALYPPASLRHIGAK
jgi:phosphohistidine phosphatase